MHSDCQQPHLEKCPSLKQGSRNRGEGEEQKGCGFEFLFGGEMDLLVVS